MKIEGDDILFESTGRKEYIFGDCLAPNRPGSVCYGSDGGISGLTAVEAKEAAEFMIAMWQEWLRSWEPE